MDVVPESILARVKSPYPATQDPAYEQALRDQLGALVRDGNAPALPLLDRDAAEQAAMTPASETTSTVSRYALEMALDLDAWLQSLDVRLDL